MAGQKKDKRTDLAKEIDDLLANAKDDRDALNTFLLDLIAEHSDQKAGIAEYVAKIADALTRQHSVMVAAIKVRAKEAPASDDTGLDEIMEEIGLPFEPVKDDGSN